jgi:hypothetical protein
MSFNEVKQIINSLALEELKLTDYIRNILINRGMYLSNTKGAYNILLPSENYKQVQLYMASADKKLNRAIKLSKNTPRSKGYDENDSLVVRAMMKRENIRENKTSLVNQNL